MSSFLSLLLAVTTLAQDSVAPPTRAGRKHRAPVAAIAPMTIAPMTVAPMMVAPMMVAPMALAIPDLQATTSALMMAQPQLDAIAAQAPLLIAQAPLAQAAQDLQMAITAIAPMAIGVFDDDSWEDETPQEPADSLYQAGRRALNRNRYQDAIAAFGQIISRYPRSARAPEALYWSAFALYRTGDTKNLQTAVGQLDRLRENYPDAVGRDAENLAARIDGVLARRGDADAAERNQARADSARSSRSSSKARTRDRVRDRGRSGGEMPAGCEDYDEDAPRMIALSAVLQMNAESAVPILRDVLKRRDPCSEIMRRKAVFIVSQKRTPETSQILLNAVRTDPDKEVREQAVFWLSQVPGEETIIALDSVLRASDDPAVQEKAIFAISQHRSARGAAILRDYAERQNAPLNLREQAIFWLGQRRSTGNAEFLRGLYAKVENDDLKDKVIFSVSQMGGAENYRWMMDIALNESEDIELRKKALFWASQGRGAEIADLVRLYDTMKDREMREQLIFVYSQRREETALDKLFAIGKSDPDRELRKKAIFWIGQSRSPRAAQYLQELINQ